MRKLTKENCHKIALEYKHRGEFSKSDHSCYSTCHHNGWLDDVCSHMEYLKLPSDYWTKEKCKEAALDCKDQKEFYKRYRMAYEFAKQNNWLIEIRSHFEIFCNSYKRLIYGIVFDDKSVYIGLTYNIDQRFDQHLTRDFGTVYNYIKDTGLTPNLLKLTDLLDVKDAIVQEDYYVEKYKLEGFNILNRSKPGALGGNSLKWNLEKCKEEALKYKHRYEFNLGSPGAYTSSRIHKWLDEVCSHMTPKRKPAGYWTKQRCREASLECKNKEQFYKNFGGAFNTSKDNNWLVEFFPKKYIR